MDELQQQVAREKKKREDKKKEQAEEKKAKEERRKKSDQEKAKANAVTISPPNIDDAMAGLDTMVLNADDKNIDPNGQLDRIRGRRSPHEVRHQPQPPFCD